MVLVRDFYNRDPVTVARELLGCRLVREIDGRHEGGRIVETEAYVGAEDSASHAYRGVTPRNRVMFGPPGQAYVYFVYGMHHMLNVVAGPEGEPGAVLIRGIHPEEGVESMQIRRRGRRPLADGPGKLCQALDIDRSFDDWDLTAGRRLWISAGPVVPAERIQMGPRVGIGYALAEHRNAPWRFRLPPDALPEFLGKNACSAR